MTDLITRLETASEGYERDLIAICGAVACLMPSEAASEHSSLEWQIARGVWLEAIDTIGYTEEVMRRAGASAMKTGIAAILRASDPIGEADAGDHTVGVNQMVSPVQTGGEGGL